MRVAGNSLQAIGDAQDPPVSAQAVQKTTSGRSSAWPAKPSRRPDGRRGCAATRSPRRYSVTPLYLFCTVTAQPAPSFPQALKSIVAWLRGVGPTKREQFLEAKLVERLADEMGEEGETEMRDKVSPVSETKSHGRIRG
jgi:hypothetical protein